MFSSSFLLLRKQPGNTSYVHSHWHRQSTPKSIRQKFQTGAQYNKRKFFGGINPTHHIQMKRISQMPSQSGSQRSREFQGQLHPTKMFSHLPGDVRREADESYYFDKRVDKVEGRWEKRGRYQVHQVGGKTETFVCFQCGYPVRSQLQVIKDDNWDFRMCYNCYVRTVNNELEDD